MRVLRPSGLVLLLTKAGVSVHLPVNPVAFERPCIPARVVPCRSCTFQVRSRLATRAQ